MKIKRGGRGKFGGAGRKEDGNCRRTLKKKKKKKKNSKVRLFARKFRPIYCKYLHVE